MTWPKRDMFAVTIDGRVLLNALALEEVDVAKLVGKKGVFIGVELRPEEVRALSERLSDATSEAAAGFVGRRRKKSRRP
jgi:hypothetical protein